MRTTIALVIAGFLFTGSWESHAVLTAAGQKKAETAPQLKKSSTRANSDRDARLAEQVRHELAMLPYYGVFDWIEAQVMPNEVVTLRGQVTRPTTRTDAERRVKQIESVSKVINQIEELPPSPSDDETRVAVYRAIFRYNSPLFRYSVQARPPIHIIVKNGRVALKGFVDDAMDKQLAYTAARGVPGIFEVKDELKVLDKDNL